MPGTQNSQSTLDFLGTIGSKDRGDNVSLNNTAKALVELAEFMITTARKNLDKKGNMATGRTASSMKAVNIQASAAKMSLDIEILSTYKFLDQGVKGVEGGKGKYAFKTKYANKKMATAILKWLRKRGAGGKVKYKAVSKNEKKNKRINKTLSTADNFKSLAYAVSVGIKKKGIDPTYFFTDAIKATEKLQKQKYAKALKLDIIQTINNN